MPIQWSDWLPIGRNLNYSNPAVYRVRWAKEGTPVPLPRFAAVDPQGILCIGKTKDMEQRRRNFVNGMRNGEGHSEADILFYLHHFGQSLSLPGPAELEYSYGPLPDEDKALLNEELLILGYITQFGEVPPLNSAIPGKKDRVAWEGARILRQTGAI